MKWSKLFIRHGFQVKEAEGRENCFDCINESKENLEFLFESLERGAVSYKYAEERLLIQSDEMDEADWIELVDTRDRGRTEMLYTKPWLINLEVSKLDTYICGIVKELNRLELYTYGSCDGHGRGSAAVYFNSEDDLETASKLFLACGIQRITTQRGRMSLHISKNKQLLDVAERLHLVQKESLDKDLEFFQKLFFLARLEETLSISGVSGDEGSIRDYVLEQLDVLTEHTVVDNAGNILAHRKYGNGHGPTIMLNAHLDTVEEFVPGRTIVKNGPVWTSSEGILGADDRAGVTVILEMARWLDIIRFNGKVKFVFTVGEEAGLIGARRLNESFLWDVDAAIVVDRRNTNDIVVSCGGVIPFCHEKYGEFFEKTAKENGLGDWNVTAGGSSDTRIWAGHGIQSVNLSAGYNNEHTDDEFLDTDACFNTLRLIQAVFKEKNELNRVLNRINTFKEVDKRRGGFAGERCVDSF
ncbi:M20/M25/M40 family metallo-hydrolase [Evansella sp. LMS18]|uniref:M20/M25/M40 family metallo-hydrolase n=1 Tax=Evansella sp. LMS18 TaxID=2924033 RepID=UPI0020D1C084|nr:M20/M25/M40 family metallo-hydrolase [Evansella sp. LMS18]UTR10210.1 M20/M25/M40 family metallo-hydrolase [Evansella sp. LMS18]